MEEQKYPIEEEDGYGCMSAAEPMEAMAYKEIMPIDDMELEEETPYNEYNIPSLGPTTSEQAINRLRKAEHQFANGRWMTADEFFSRTRKIIDQNAASIL